MITKIAIYVSAIVTIETKQEVTLITSKFLYGPTEQ